MQGKTNSAVFRTKQELFERSLNDAYRRFWAKPEPARRYMDYLVQLHQFVRASVPLMEAARARSAELAEGDPVAAALVGYFDEHIPEERGHDQWILEDVEAAGGSRSALLAKIPSPRVASLVGAQYYWIAHHHPLALLGYIAVFEEPPPLDFLDDLERRTGLPHSAFRMLREHGQIDPHHRQRLDELIDALPLSPSDTSLLGVSLAHCTSALEDCVSEL